MEIKINKSIAKGVITAPPSKSYGHRLLIAGALSKNAEIHNLSFCNDIEATYQSLNALGYHLERVDDVVYINDRREASRILDCQESGSTLRFLIPLCLLEDEEITLKGSKKLFSRGLDIYIDIFKKQNIYYHLEEDSLTLKGKIKADKFIFRGDISSQFITGLLFVLPLLDDDSEIILSTPLESASYVDMSIHTLKAFGVIINRIDNHIHIKGKQKYNSHLRLKNEGDYSNAAFIDALNVLGGEVEIKGLNPCSIQADKEYNKYFSLIKEGCPNIDISNNIDLGPILFTLSILFHGATFKGIKRLRIKESDRIDDLLDSLKEYDVKYELKDDEIHLYPTKEIKKDIHLHPV